MDRGIYVICVHTEGSIEGWIKGGTDRALETGRDIAMERRMNRGRPRNG
jgi:hypothetical protein